MNERHRTALTVALAIALIVAVPLVTELLTAAGEDAGPAGDADGVRSDDRLPADPDEVLTRVETLTGAEDLEDVNVVIENGSNVAGGSGESPPFFQAIGLFAPNESGRALAQVSGERTIVVSRALLDHPSRFEGTLSHEYTHLLQTRANAPDRVASSVSDNASQPGDGAMVVWALYEGGATYVEQAYWERHVDAGTPPDRLTAASYRNASGLQQYLLSGHHYGYRYLDGRVDDPAALGAVYDDPPRTTEELLHGLEPGSEPVRPLSVSVADEWARTRRSATMGELFVRVLLETELSPDTAATGADGWGNDTRLSLVRNGTRGHVWITTWDDAANASEFENAFRGYLSERATREGDRWKLAHGTVEICGTDGTVVAVCAGEDAFLDAISVAVAGDTVRIRAQNATTRAEVRPNR